MELQNLMNHFAHIRTGEIKIKNRIFTFIPAIIIPTFLILFAVFLILFLSLTPLETETGMIYPGDPLYDISYYILLAVFGGVFILGFIIMIITLVIKPKPWVMWTVDYDNQIIFYETTRRYNRLVGPNYLFEVNRMSGGMFQSRKPKECEDALKRTIFWVGLPEQSNLKIVSTLNKVKLTIPDHNRSEKRSYTIRFDANEIIQSYVEIISTSAYRGSNLKSWKKCYIENQNRQVRMNIDPAIRKAMQENNIYLAN
jgi:hypothetical protein